MLSASLAPVADTYMKRALGRRRCSSMTACSARVSMCVRACACACVCVWRGVGVVVCECVPHLMVAQAALQHTPTHPPSPPPPPRTHTRARAHTHPRGLAAVLCARHAPGRARCLARQQHGLAAAKALGHEQRLVRREHACWPCHGAAMRCGTSNGHVAARVWWGAPRAPRVTHVCGRRRHSSAQFHTCHTCHTSHMSHVTLTLLLLQAVFGLVALI
jgi:hypothetical protein